MGTNVPSARWLSKNCVAVVSLPHQEKPFVSLDGPVIYHHEITPQWKLIDPIGQAHVVSYHRNFHDSVLFEGFLEIRKFYALTGYHWCLIKHKGGSQFDMSIFNEKDEEISYHRPAPFHPSLNKMPVFNQISTQPFAYIWYPCSFTCTLAKTHIKSSQMHLPKHVHDYILREGVGNWTLRGPYGKQGPCRIVGITNKRRAQFGKGWKAFCRANKFQAGDMISFFLTSKQLAVIDVVLHPKVAY